jgi:hypothetical protein
MFRCFFAAVFAPPDRGNRKSAKTASRVNNRPAKVRCTRPTTCSLCVATDASLVVGKKATPSAATVASVLSLLSRLNPGSGL